MFYPKSYGSDQGWYGVVSVSFTTLDPANKGANQALSNGNLTDTASSTGNGIARSIANHSTGKYYAEFTVGSASNMGVGITNASQSLSDFIGDTSNSMAAGYGGGWIGGGAGGTITAPNIQTAGHTFGIAVDVDNKAAWIKDITAAGNWNANASANPATNTNGATYTITGAIYLGVTCAFGGDNVTFNFGASAYTGTPPSGFGNW